MAAYAHSAPPYFPPDVADEELSHLRGADGSAGIFSFWNTTALTPQMFAEIADEDAEERIYRGLHEADLRRLVGHALDMPPATKRQIVLR